MAHPRSGESSATLWDQHTSSNENGRRLAAPPVPQTRCSKPRDADPVDVPAALRRVQADVVRACGHTDRVRDRGPVLPAAGGRHLHLAQQDAAGVEVEGQRAAAGAGDAVLSRGRAARLPGDNPPLPKNPAP